MTHVRRSATFVNTLSEHYDQGDWKQLQKDVQAVIAAAITALRAGCAPDPLKTQATIPTLLDTKVSYVAVTWVGRDPLEDKPVIRRVVVHDPMSEAAFALDLPGIAVEPNDPQLAELFVSRNARAESISRFTSTREDNPLTAQLPAFVQAIAGPLFGIIGTVPPGAKAVPGGKEKSNST